MAVNARIAIAAEADNLHGLPNGNCVCRLSGEDSSGKNFFESQEMIQ